MSPWISILGLLSQTAQRLGVDVANIGRTENDLRYFLERISSVGSHSRGATQKSLAAEAGGLAEVHFETERSADEV